MEFLPIETVRNRHAEIGAALEKLLTAKPLVSRKGARQWQFLRDSFQVLIAPDIESDFHALPPVQVAQYKFELEDRLKRYYLHPGNPVDYVFSLVHRLKLPDYFDADLENYPVLAGYCLLVRDLSIDRNSNDQIDGENLSLYLERVVAEASDAEFRAYAALPDIKAEELGNWFCKGSPALNEIMNILTRHNKKRWVISNPFNPSTKRLLKVKVKNAVKLEARVDTMEYWYLRWWDELDGSYAYSYRETNRQMYVLKKENGDWKVFENLRGQPRTSAPNRWNRRQRL